MLLFFTWHVHVQQWLCNWVGYPYIYISLGFLNKCFLLLLLRTCYCNHVYILCVCKNPKFQCLTDTPVSLPTSSPPGSGSVVSETPIPVLNMMPLSGPPVPVLCTMPLSDNPPGAVPDTSGPCLYFLYV